MKLKYKFSFISYPNLGLPKVYNLFNQVYQF